MATIQELKDRLPNRKVWAVYNSYSDRHKRCWNGVVVKECTLLGVSYSFRNKEGTLTGPTDYCRIRKHDKHQNETFIKASLLFFDASSAQGLAAKLRKDLAAWLAAQ